ncbi:hypothetical protein RI054_30g120720 [Pseudoscourfieldia marina]
MTIPIPPKDDLEEMVVLGVSNAMVANAYQVSERTVKTWLKRYGIRRTTVITNDVLETWLVNLVENGILGVNDGYRQAVAALAAVGVSVPLRQVMAAWRTLFPEETEARRRWVALATRRREYYAPHFGAAYHVDANLKLVFFGIYVTACVDGCSRSVLYMKPLLSLAAIDVLRPYHAACSEHGVPDVLAIDRGNENCLLQQVMWVTNNGQLDASRLPPVLFSKSIHNTRVERVWVEFNVRFVSFVNEYTNSRPAILTNDNLWTQVRHVVFVLACTFTSDLVEVRAARRIVGPRGGVPNVIRRLLPNPRGVRPPSHTVDEYVEAWRLVGGTANEAGVPASFDAVHDVIEMHIGVRRLLGALRTRDWALMDAAIVLVNNHWH